MAVSYHLTSRPLTIAGLSGPALPNGYAVAPMIEATPTTTADEPWQALRWHFAVPDSEPSAETRKGAPKPPRPALTPRIQSFERGSGPTSALRRALGTYGSLIFRVEQTQQASSRHSRGQKCEPVHTRPRRAKA
jgi:hypothetical protein